MDVQYLAQEKNLSNRLYLPTTANHKASITNMSRGDVVGKKGNTKHFLIQKSFSERGANN